MAQINQHELDALAEKLQAKAKRTGKNVTSHRKDNGLLTVTVIPAANTKGMTMDQKKKILREVG